MHESRYKHWLYGAGVFLAASIAVLWSWNTLVALFEGPAIQYKHAVAIMLAVALFKWTFHRPPGGGRRLHDGTDTQRPHGA